MELQQVIDASNRAQEIHEAMQAITSTPPSVDALFLCAYLELKMPRAKRAYAATPIKVPNWFVDAVARAPAETRTASGFLKVADAQAMPWDCKQAGAWLRQLGFTSRKSNGRIYFERCYPPTLPASLPASLAK